MGNLVTLYDFAAAPFNYAPILISAAVAIAGAAIYKIVARIVRKPKRGGPWLQRRTMVMYAGIAMMLASLTVLAVSLVGELIEYDRSSAAYEAGLTTVEGAVAELPPLEVADEGDAGLDAVVAPRRGFAVGGVEFVFAESGVRYGYLGDADGKPPGAGTTARVGYYDRKGVNVILKLEVAR